LKNKFIVMLLLLFGASCFGAAMPYPGREIEIEVLPVRLDDPEQFWPRTVPTQAETDLYQGLLKAGTDLVDQSVPEANLKFNQVPYRWLRPGSADRRNPATEADLDDLFDNLSIGPDPLWKYRTLVVHFVPSLPSPFALTSGRYLHGSYKGITWVCKSAEWAPEVAFAYSGEPLAPSQSVFAEAFRQYFMERHAIGSLSDSVGEGVESQLRSRLMGKYGIGHFEPKYFCEYRREPGQNVLQLNCRDVVPDRCYRLEYSPDLTTWTRVWVNTYQVPYTEQAPLKIRRLATAAAGYYRFSQCPDLL
jgi:hypothetical protein